MKSWKFDWKFFFFSSKWSIFFTSPTMKKLSSWRKIDVEVLFVIVFCCNLTIGLRLRKHCRCFFFVKKNNEKTNIKKNKRSFKTCIKTFKISFATLSILFFKLFLFFVCLLANFPGKSSLPQAMKPKKLATALFRYFSFLYLIAS